MILIQSSSSNMGDHKFQLEFFSHNKFFKKRSKEIKYGRRGERKKVKESSDNFRTEKATLL